MRPTSRALGTGRVRVRLLCPTSPYVYRAPPSGGETTFSGPVYSAVLCKLISARRLPAARLRDSSPSPLDPANRFMQSIRLNAEHNSLSEQDLELQNSNKSQSSRESKSTTDRTMTAAPLSRRDERGLSLARSGRASPWVSPDRYPPLRHCHSDPNSFGSIIGYLSTSIAKVGRHHLRGYWAPSEAVAAGRCRRNAASSASASASVVSKRQTKRARLRLRR